MNTLGSLKPFLVCSPNMKRKLPTIGGDDGYSSSSAAEDYDGIDISSAVTGKRPRLNAEGEEDLADFIQASIAKRSIKEGTQLIKNSKGKSKLAKGEVGGGSFQSMGLYILMWPAACN